MRMLVTGGTGFVGRKLAHRLLGSGHEVFAMGRNEIVGKRLEQAGITFLKIDLSDEAAVIAACEKIDYVFHCGAFSSPWGEYEQFYKSNVLGTMHVIQGCKIHGVKRLIHVSTPSIYFQYDDRIDVKEDDPLPEHFANHYAETKYLAEKEIDKAYREGLPVITIRPRAIFGPGDTAIIPRLIKVNEEKFIPLIHEGKARLDLTYVENVVDALLLCMNSPEETLGEKYNISNGEQVQLKEILETLFQTLDMPLRYKKVPYGVAFRLAELLEWVSRTFQNNKEPLLTKYTVSVISKTQTLNIEKAKKELGYEPKISVNEGIELYAKWWKQQQS